MRSVNNATKTCHGTLQDKSQPLSWVLTDTVNSFSHWFHYTPHTILPSQPYSPYKSELFSKTKLPITFFCNSSWMASPPPVSLKSAHVLIFLSFLIFTLHFYAIPSVALKIGIQLDPAIKLVSFLKFSSASNYLISVFFYEFLFFNFVEKRV